LIDQYLADGWIYLLIVSFIDFDDLSECRRRRLRQRGASEQISI